VPDTEAVARWFEQERGISRETLRHFNVTVRDDGAVLLPYPNGEKIRKGIPHGEREFYFTSGRKPDLFNQEEGDREGIALVEGETDTMRLWQEVNANGNDDNRVGVVGLSGIETWHDDLAQHFTGKRVYVILDNDKDYNVQGRVDAAWRSIRASLGSKARRVRLPGDVKDICEFFHTGYTMENLSTLMQSTSATSRWQPLDLTQPPPPVPWLVDNLIVRGATHTIMGEPGIGKSWLTMALCLGVIRGTDWLGQSIDEPGRVLYVDEENADVLVFHRLRRQLGMTDEEAKQVRYLSNQGILLDRDPDSLVDEALEFGPSLIVLDSLTRFHMGDEDKAGPMAHLYNMALKPLARETGAALVLLHHAGKTESTSSYRRSRGSGEIVANVDIGIDARQSGINSMTLATFKSRFRQAGDVLHVAITDTPEGGVKLIGGATPDPPF
jgi:hypothetical protein